MKKILIALTIVLSCVGIRSVSADTIELVHSDTAEIYCNFYVTDYDYLKQLGYDDEVQELYNLIIKKYNEEYSSTYPYFLISLEASSDKNCNYISSFDKVGNIAMSLLMYSELPVTENYQFPFTSTYISASYDVSNAIYNLPVAHINEGNATVSHPLWAPDNIYYPLRYFVSNFDFVINGSVSFNITGNSNFTIKPGDVLKPMFTVENAFQNNYTEINLNDYAFVALSLKDYTKDSFETTIQVKGEYCVNAVYDYGLSAKEKYDSSVTDICSPYYDNYTPVRHYVLDNDIKNHAIYYLKAHDINKENKIKVDSSIFNIHYITEEEADNPIININGRDYSILPFDELPSNSIKNTEEGNWPGASEEFSFSDIFTAPLEFLKDIWDSIASVFDLVKEFFSLLPEPIPTFLLSSFLLGLAIGLLKLIF